MPRDLLGRCGDSGNSTEPHVHLQTIDDRAARDAAAVPISFDGRLPRNGDIVDAGIDTRAGGADDEPSDAAPR